MILWEQKGERESERERNWEYVQHFLDYAHAMMLILHFMKIFWLLNLKKMWRKIQIFLLFKMLSIYFIFSRHFQIKRKFYGNFLYHKFFVSLYCMWNANLSIFFLLRFYIWKNSLWNIDKDCTIRLLHKFPINISKAFSNILFLFSIYSLNRFVK